jgi:hypothetical protein
MFCFNDFYRYNQAKIVDYAVKKATKRRYEEESCEELSDPDQLPALDFDMFGLDPTSLDDSKPIAKKSKVLMY